MIDHETLLAISTMMDSKLDPIREDVNDLKKEVKLVISPRLKKLENTTELEILPRLKSLEQTQERDFAAAEES